MVFNRVAACPLSGWPGVKSPRPHQSTACNMQRQRPIIIAHRGASGYLPENTLAAKAVAHAQGADYWETDVLATHDGELVVLHDLYLEDLSDVGQKYPARARDDGHFYVMDFTLAELRELCMTERIRTDRPGAPAVYPKRFPPRRSRFQIHTLAEEIELLQGLNQSFGREVGLYLELKAPWFHEDAGFDLCKAALQTLKAYGYSQKTDSVILETFDARALQRIRLELLPQLNMDLRLGQLIGHNEWQATCERDSEGNWNVVDSDWMISSEGLSRVAAYADGVGVAIELLFGQGVQSPHDLPRAADWIGQARALGLFIHAYTLRADALPPVFAGLDAAHDWLIRTAKVDGVFTDHPDLMLTFLLKS